MYTERAGKIANLEEMLDKDVYVLCHNDKKQAFIDGSMIYVLRRIMENAKRRDGAALVIQTRGGMGDAAYYIGAFFREYYDYIETYVVGDCYSGGTMIALSTDKIFLSHSGCLGPIDAQFYPVDDEMKGSWFPGLIGLVEALEKAFEKNEISDGLKEAFHNDWNVLALYFKEKYTFKDLFGEYVKKHCADEAVSEKVWDFLSALNDSHVTPLTYKRLVKMGLNVQLMESDVEKAIKSIVRDVESEFGDLRSKAAIYDFFDSSFSSRVYGNDGDTNDEVDEDISENLGNTENTKILNKCKVVEKLAVIETSVMGFIETREVGVLSEGGMPIDTKLISNGWDEELNTSLVSDEQQEELNALLQYFTSIAISEAGYKVEEIDADRYKTILEDTNNSLMEMAVDALRNSGCDVDTMPRSELYAMTVEYLLRNPNLVSFEAELEVGLREYCSRNGMDYDNLGALDKLAVYGEFCDEVKKALGMSDEMFERLTVEEQYDLLLNFCERHCE